MLSEYPLVKSFMGYKETPSYFLFSPWGYPPLPPDPFVGICRQKQRCLVVKEDMAAVADPTQGVLSARVMVQKQSHHDDHDVCSHSCNGFPRWY